MKTKLLFLAMLFSLSGFGQVVYTGDSFKPSKDNPITISDTKYTLGNVIIGDNGVLSTDWILKNHPDVRVTPAWRSYADTISTETGWLVYLSSHGKVTVGKNAKAHTISQSNYDENTYSTFQEFHTKKKKVIPNNSVILFKPNNK